MNLTFAPDSVCVRTDQMRGLIRLVADTRDIPDIAGRCAHFIEGLRRLLGARTGLLLLDEDFRPGGRGRLTPLGAAGVDDECGGAIGALARFGASFNPAIRRILDGGLCFRTSGPVTHTRQELLADSDWERSTYFQDYLRPSALDHELYSGMDRGPGQPVLGMGFQRPPGDRPFDDRDRNLVQLAHLEIAELLAPTPAAELRAKLAPRAAETLDQLLTGASEKEAADRLGLSPHTVHQYVKAIYRAAGVSSRGELLAACLRRG
jgi:DNA-binding CsgD family transcriptional regulator